VRGIRVWARLVGLQRAVVEGVWIGDEGEVVVCARPVWRERDRCGICRRRSPGLTWAVAGGAGARWISAAGIGVCPMFCVRSG
jgi:transposase